MEYIAPDYYKEFHCTADECEDTCCAGWQIAVDKKSMENYKKVKGSYRRKLWSSINWLTSTFKQSSDLRCAFLNDDNLCDMYQNLGAKSLCKTCRLYPRHIEEFEGVREITLSLSCPEVAKILMNRMTPVTFLTVERDGEEEYDDFDPFLYSQLVDAREVMIQILQDRTMAMDVRARLVFGIAHDIQNRIDTENLFACFEVLEKYQKPAAKEFVEHAIACRSVDYEFHRAKRAFYVLNQMELLRPNWALVLDEAKQRLYTNTTAEMWDKTTKEFYDWIESHAFPWEIQKEQLYVYFISTYFCGAVYNGEVLAKASIALTSVLLIEELLKCVWLRNDRSFDVDDVVELVARFSREIEHSDQNLERLTHAKIFV